MFSGSTRIASPVFTAGLFVLLLSQLLYHDLSFKKQQIIAASLTISLTCCFVSLRCTPTQNDQPGKKKTKKKKNKKKQKETERNKKKNPHCVHGLICLWALCCCCVSTCPASPWTKAWQRCGCGRRTAVCLSASGASLVRRGRHNLKGLAAKMKGNEKDNKVNPPFSPCFLLVAGVWQERRRRWRKGQRWKDGAAGQCFTPAVMEHNCCSLCQSPCEVVWQGHQHTI